MQRQTVDFGIDLGTTNSVIARATHRGIKIVPNRMEGDITPSAVALSTRGEILVGRDALDKPDITAAVQFKRMMGTTNRITMTDGSKMSPEQLSAEVLKDLKSSVQLRYDIVPEQVVITVPAMFQQPQCEATHRAAELAGLEAVVLLQEPIAAATAYLNDDPVQGAYLVYDLGGGTFDVSIVTLRDGEMSVCAHGGDNYLGGSDFDRRLFEWALSQVERKNHMFPHLSDPPLRSRFLAACEDARKRLSLHETATIDVSDFSLPVAEIPITRNTLDDLIEPYVTRTVNITREQLAASSLTPDDIRCILLVGGPTRTPYVRRRLREDLGIELSFDPNPMTVVAAGASIHASTLLKPERTVRTEDPSSREAVIDLFYEPVSVERECGLSGKVTLPVSFVGDIRISRTSGDWDTGWISLDNGAFVTTLLLGRENVTDFQITLRGISGTLWPVSPSSIAIRYGVAAARPVAPYNYGVALADGTMELVVDQGTPLPAYGTGTFIAVKSVPAGTDDELVVYFLEGNSGIAKDNIRVGELHVKGQDLKRTLREGEQIHVRIHMDESRRLTARVSVPAQDLDYQVDMLSCIDKPPVSDLRASMSEIENSIDFISGLAVTGDASISDPDQKIIMHVARELELLEAELAGAEIRALDEPERLAKRIAEIKAEARTVYEKYEGQIAYCAALHEINEAVVIVREFDDYLGATALDELRSDAERSLRLNDTRGLAAVKQRALDIYWKHYSKTERCWNEQVEFLRERRHLATNSRMYYEHLKNAQDCLRNDDREGARWHVRKAWDYLPDAQAKLNRFYDAGLERL